MTTIATFFGGIMDGAVRTLPGKPAVIIAAKPRWLISPYGVEPLADPDEPRPVYFYDDTGRYDADGHRIFRLSTLRIKDARP